MGAFHFQTEPRTRSIQWPQLCAGCGRREWNEQFHHKFESKAEFYCCSFGETHRSSAGASIFLCSSCATHGRVESEEEFRQSKIIVVSLGAAFSVILTLLGIFHVASTQGHVSSGDFADVVYSVFWISLFAMFVALLRTGIMGIKEASRARTISPFLRYVRMDYSGKFTFSSDRFHHQFRLTNPSVKVKLSKGISLRTRLWFYPLQFLNWTLLLGIELIFWYILVIELRFW